jgi:hypothetical protein
MQSQIRRRWGRDSLSLLGPVLDAALLLGHGAAAALAGGVIPAVLVAPDRGQALAVGAPVHQRDLGLTLAGVGVDGRAVIGVLVLVEVDGHGPVGGVDAPVAGFVGRGGGGVLWHRCREDEVEGEEGNEGFDGEHLGCWLGGWGWEEGVG